MKSRIFYFYRGHGIEAVGSGWLGKAIGPGPWLKDAAAETKEWGWGHGKTVWVGVVGSSRQGRAVGWGRWLGDTPQKWSKDGTAGRWCRSRLWDQADRQGAMRQGLWGQASNVVVGGVGVDVGMEGHGLGIIRLGRRHRGWQSRGGHDVRSGMSGLVGSGRSRKVRLVPLGMVGAGRLRAWTDVS